MAALTLREVFAYLRESLSLTITRRPAVRETEGGFYVQVMELGFLLQLRDPESGEYALVSEQTVDVMGGE